MPDDAWHCAACVSQRSFGARIGVGEAALQRQAFAFAAFVSTLEKSNPREFALPARVKTYFDGVKSGPEGEYEDIQPPPVKPTK